MVKDREVDVLKGNVANATSDMICDGELKMMLIKDEVDGEAKLMMKVTLIF